MMNRGKLLVLLFGCAVVFVACGSDGAETTTGGVASVSDLDETLEDAEALAAERAAQQAEEGEDTAASGDITPEEAGLAFAVCVRDNGYPDFPDPLINADGTPDVRGAIIQSGFDFAQPGFRDQAEACRDEVGATNLGAGGRNDGVREQIQERLLGYTQCLRDEGLDVGDLTPPGQGGQGQAQQGQQGAGRAQGNIGTTQGRGQRVAQVLGLDADDPATAAALEACDDVLTQAFAGLTGGGTPPPNQG